MNLRNSLAMVIGLSLVAPCYAEPVTCPQVLKACDDVVNAKNEQLRVYGVAIQGYEAETTRLVKENRDLNSKSESMFRNPFLYFALGLVAGVVVSK